MEELTQRRDAQALVWKEVNYGQMSEKEKQLIVSEVNILRELRHPHIVRYLDRVIDKQATKIYIVMEYCEGGDLSQYIKRKKREGCVGWRSTRRSVALRPAANALLLLLLSAQVVHRGRLHLAHFHTHLPGAEGVPPPP